MSRLKRLGEFKGQSLVEGFESDQERTERIASGKSTNQEKAVEMLTELFPDATVSAAATATVRFVSSTYTWELRMAGDGISIKRGPVTVDIKGPSFQASVMAFAAIAAGYDERKFR